MERQFFPLRLNKLGLALIFVRVENNLPVKALNLKNFFDNFCLRTLKKIELWPS